MSNDTGEITAVLAQEILDGLAAGLDIENARRRKAGRKPTTLPIYLRGTYPQEGAALAKRWYRLKKCVDELLPGGVSSDDVNNYCRIMEKVGAGDDAKSIRILYEDRYRPILPFVAPSKTTERTYQRNLVTLIKAQKGTLNSLADRDFRHLLLKNAVQARMAMGGPANVMPNLITLLNASKGNNDYLGLSGNVWNAFRADVLTVAAHTFYRFGYAYEESAIAEEMESRGRDTRDPLLQVNLHAHRHLRDLNGRHAFEALTLRRRHEFSSPLSTGLARLLIYASEACIHRGDDVDEFSPELGMPVREALESACQMAKEDGDLDGALRFKTVLVRAYLWRHDWEVALGEAAKIWSDIRSQDKDLPHAIMRLSYEEYVAHRMQAAEGIAGGSESATAALERARIASRRAGGAPILSQSHKREYKKMAGKYNLEGLEIRY